MLQHQAIILASQSAARAALLRAAGILFEARPARIDEAAIKAAARAEGLAGEPGAAETALLLARLKAARIRAPGQLVVGADQILVCDGTWFDKPETPAAAAAQLRQLRGRPHTLLTAIVCMKDGTEIWNHTARPRLTMRTFSDAFLEAYLAAETGRLTETVGAYRIEGRGMQLFDTIDGEFSAILGLPLLPLLAFLRQHGILGP